MNIVFEKSTLYNVNLQEFYLNSSYVHGSAMHDLGTAATLRVNAGPEFPLTLTPHCKQKCFAPDFSCSTAMITILF